MQALLDQVRKVCLPGLWSQGVKLAREGAVSRAPDDGGQPSFRVRAAGHVVAPTVTLYVDDGEWSCDCGGKADPCAHVAGAVIFASQAANAAPGAEAASASATALAARVAYRLGRKDRLLTLRRAIVLPGGREEPITGGLASLVGRGRLPPSFAPTHADLDVDRLFAGSAKEVVPLGAIGTLFGSLSTLTDVTFDGAAVRVSPDPVLPRASVEDADGGGFVLRLERDPRVTDVVAHGVVRVGDVLHPVGEPETTGYSLERLPLARTYPETARAELVTDVLPELEKKLPLEVRTKRLPRLGQKATPRIDLDLSHEGGHTLSVLPTLVYGDPPVARVDGDTLVLFGDAAPVRDRDAERELVKKLREELHFVPGRRLNLDGVEATRFAARIRESRRKQGDARAARVFDGRPLLARIDVTGDHFDVVFECDVEAEGTAAPARRRADTAAVIRAWRDGLDLVPLDGGGWAPLPIAWLEQHGQRVMDLLAARDEEKRVARAALPELGALCEALDVAKPLELSRLAPLLDGFTSIPRAALPAGIRATLRHYQEAGVDWLSFLRDAGLGAVLADDMGLGKTLQTICALRGRALVVCPKSVVYNWAEEIAKFRPSLRVAAYHGPSRLLDPKADVTLTTYAVLRIDVERLSKESWDVVVLDEAQAIKNPESQTAQAAFSLRGDFRVALSGTPVENRLDELWSILNFTNPGLLGGRSDFRDRYAVPIGAGEAGAAARLRAKIRPFVLRRLKRDVVPELPPRTDVVLHVELDEAERATYDTIRAATKKDVVARLSQGGSVLAVLEALLRLRQAACHSALVPGQKADSSSKVERLVEALEEAAADGHKALVFSQWTSLLDLVQPHLAAAGIRYSRLDGSTRDRGAVVSDFQADSGPPVLLVSLKAGGTGLNLTAADHVFLLDPWWNPAVEDQAADRAHRIGQDKPVFVYRMVARDTVEERLLALQEKKRALAEAALGEASQAHAITREELLALLE